MGGQVHVRWLCFWGLHVGAGVLVLRRDSGTCPDGSFRYYNNELQLLRTDELFAWNATAACDKFLAGFVYQQDFNLYPDGVLNVYFIQPGDTTLTCMSTPLPYWWDADYLEDAEVRYIALSYLGESGL